MLKAGDKIGRLTVLRVDGQDVTAKCECGEYTLRKRVSMLDARRNGRTSSCGCFVTENMNNLLELRRQDDWVKGRPSPKRGSNELNKHADAVKRLTGKRFGSLVVTEVLVPDPPGSSRRVECRCDCGQHCVKAVHHLRAGNGTHCGCQHGLAKASRIPSPQTERTNHV